MGYNPYHDLHQNVPLLHAAAAVSHLHHPGGIPDGFLPPESSMGMGFMSLPQEHAIPKQELQQEPRKKRRIKKEADQPDVAGRRELPGPPQKRRRAKKPVGAPTRPKSAYMFFLGQFRENWKAENPGRRKVAEVAQAAGELWRNLTPEQKVVYEELSMKSKADYAVSIAEYERDHPKPPRRVRKERDPSELKRPQSAYFFFLADFRDEYKEQHPGDAPPVKIIGSLAGVRWRAMSAEQRAPYDDRSSQSKAEYARMKRLTPEERVMVAAAAAMSAGSPQAPPTADGNLPPQGVLDTQADLGAPQQQDGLPDNGFQFEDVLHPVHQEF
ncbi:hypothetical protein WJX72_009043 [[Myrmecia] bisecta]|uniref:HMG box domain-containing protein n=1 Tax=[Myrmecia] bisecta TaxID=41462 RepID=A0AAW1PTD6_9CHLO